MSPKFECGVDSSFGAAPLEGELPLDEAPADGEEEFDRNYLDGDAVRQSGARKGKISGSTQ